MKCLSVRWSDCEKVVGLVGLLVGLVKLLGSKLCRGGTRCRIWQSVSLFGHKIVDVNRSFFNIKVDGFAPVCHSHTLWKKKKRSKMPKTPKMGVLGGKVFGRIRMDGRIRMHSMPAAQRFPDAEHKLLIRPPL